MMHLSQPNKVTETANKDTSAPHTCRFCAQPLTHSVVNLGMSPLANAMVPSEQRHQREIVYPLQVFVCQHCFLVQLDECESPEKIFSHYTYFSSFSSSWLAHAEAFTDWAVAYAGLNAQSQVIELASNDGYLLQYFQWKNIPVLGIEPAANVAQVAQEKGIDTMVRFFGRQLATELVQQGIRADLLIGNNVLAHVPDLNDFVAGMKQLLNDTGTISMEFPHLVRLVAENQFDTIYHEHFSYFSLTAVQAIFAAHGLTLFDVSELSTHGGSLRVLATHSERQPVIQPSVTTLLEREEVLGIRTMAYYKAFGEQVKETKRKLLSFLIQAKREGKQIVGYGAPAKGNTLLNYCGVRTDFLDYTVDKSPYKQGNLLPGTRIPVLPPEKIFETQPDYVLILPWNLREEIMTEMADIRQWGGQFVVPIPEPRILSP